LIYEVVKTTSVTRLKSNIEHFVCFAKVILKQFVYLFQQIVSFLNITLKFYGIQSYLVFQIHYF